MKKVFIGLLLLAAVGAGYYLLVIKKKVSPVSVVNKDLLIGNWQVDTVMLHNIDSSTIAGSSIARAIDSALAKSTWSFDSIHLRIKYSSDSTHQHDTSRYEWAATNKIQIQPSANKANADSLLVERLINDSLVLVTADSARLYLTKLK